MALQNFVDRVGPVVGAAWLNLVDRFIIGPGIPPNERTAIEILNGVIPANYAYDPGYSGRFGEYDSVNFGTKFNGMHGLYPIGPDPAAYAGFVVNAPASRLNLGSNWVSPTGVGRQMHHTGYATMLQLDENGAIGFYTQAASTAAGVEWQGKYSFIIQANGQQSVNSNGAGVSWIQLIGTGAVTDGVGSGTARMNWGCVGADGAINASYLAGDAFWALTDVTKSYWFGASARFVGGVCELNGSVTGISGYNVYKLDGVTKSITGINVNANQLGAGTAVGDTVTQVAASQNYWLLVNGGATKGIGVTSLGEVSLPSVGTTASVANAVLDNAADNNVLRSTSSIKYKTDVVDLPKMDIIGRLRPILYRSKCAADDPTKLWHGFIAEEVVKVEPRLVTYGVKGEPEGVQYERIVVALVQEVQGLMKEIKGLKTQVAELNARFIPQ